MTIPQYVAGCDVVSEYKNGAELAGSDISKRRYFK
jgi:hypothetical protein